MSQAAGTEGAVDAGDRDATDNGNSPGIGCEQSAVKSRQSSMFRDRFKALFQGLHCDSDMENEESLTPDALFRPGRNAFLSRKRTPGCEANVFKYLLRAAEAGHTPAFAYFGFCFEAGVGTQVDVSQALSWYTKGSTEGDPFAHYMLAHCYYDGVGVEKDAKRAFDLCIKAAEGGDLEAQFMVSEFYMFGEVMPYDPVKAFDWLQKQLKVA